MTRERCTICDRPYELREPAEPDTIEAHNADLCDDCLAVVMDEEDE